MSGMPNKRRARSALARLRVVLASLALALSQVLGLLSPTAAWAAADTVRATTVRDAYAGGTCSNIAGDSYGNGTGGYTGHAAAWELEDGTIAYCASGFAYGDVRAGTWATFSKSTLADPTLSYIVAHGYPNTNTIGGTEFSDADARLATAFAIWTAVGDTLLTRSNTKPLLEAAQRLVDEARANGESEAGKNKYWIYAPEDSGLQCLLIAELTGSAKLVKSSSNAAITDGNGCYSLAGAVYSVYSDEGLSNKVGELTTTEDGTTNTLEDLTAGTYYVKETSSAHNYALDQEVHTLDVVAGETKTLEVSDVPQNDPNGISVAKLDEETGKASALGAATLAGAEFTVRYYAGEYTLDTLPSEATRTWVLRTDENGNTSFDAAQSNPDAYFVSGDAFYTDSTGSVCAPMGTYVVEETKAPEGYNLPEGGARSIQVVTGTGQAEWVEVLNEAKASDEVKRGDLSLNKVDGETMKRLAGVAFRVTSKTTGESHVVVTDENGEWSSEASFAAHTQSTNANDAAVASDGAVDESKLDASAGIWFSGSADQTTDPDDSRGALPYDTYTIEELRSSANEGKKLVTVEAKVSRDGYTVSLGTLDDNEMPQIGTTLVDRDTLSHAAKAQGSVTLDDEVRYENLTAGETYELTGTLMDSETGEAVKNADGTEVTATSEFTPSASSGTQTVSFTFDASALAGRSVVAFESLAQGDVTVATHEDLTDKGQTVSFPEIGTTLTGDEGSHEVAATGTVTLTDIVAYSGLEAGTSYTVTGTLYDKATGQAVKGADGSVVTGTTEFRATASDGQVEVAFEFDASLLAGHTVVAYESVSTGGRELAVHADLDDKGQTVYLPKIGTTLTAPDGTHEATSLKAVALTDEVAYENLTPGEEYTATATLHLRGSDGSDLGALRENGELWDGEGDEPDDLVTAEATFTAAEAAEGQERSSGTAKVAFGAVDLSCLGAGQAVVAYESVERAGAVVATHEDISDEGQSVTVPSIGTKLADASDGDQEVAPGTVDLTDTVSYENLLPDTEYELTGTLHVRGADGADQGVLLSDGSVYQATSTDQAAGSESSSSSSSSTGGATAKVEFDGKSQYVAVGDGDSEVPAGTWTATMSADADVELSVWQGGELSADGALEGGSRLTTVAWSASTGEFSTVPDEGDAVSLGASAPLTLADGDWLCVSGKGTLSLAKASSGASDDKDDDAGDVEGGSASTAGGTAASTLPDNAVTATATFKTPSAADGETRVSGTAEVTFKGVDVSALAGRAVVAYEGLSRGGSVVARHADISDEGQTVDVVETGKATPSSSSKSSGSTLAQTGTGVLPYVAIAGGVAAMAAGAVWYVRRFR